MKQRLLGNELKRRMARGAFWTLTGTALGKLLVLLAGIACARLLGQTAFGELGMVRSTINMFIVFGAAGIGVTATRFVARYRSSDPQRAASVCRLSNRFALWLGLVSMAAMVVCSEWLADDILHTPHLHAAIIIGALMLLMSILNGSLNGILAGLEDFKAIALCTLVGSIGEAALMTLGAWLWQLKGAVLGFGLGVVLLYGVYRLAVSNALQQAGISLRGVPIQRKDWQLLLTFSLPAALSALMVAPVFWVIRAMLVRESGYEELAVFEAADQWKVIILFIPGAVSQIALPILSGMDTPDGFGRTLRLHIRLIAGIATVLAVLLIVAAPYVMTLYGDGYTDYAALMLLAVSVVFSAVSNVMEMAVYSIGKMWTCLTFNIGWAVAVCLFTALLLPLQWGASALALAVLLAYLLKSIALGSYIRFTLHRTAP